MKSLITSFNVTGSTAGQIGLAWGWYMVSPDLQPALVRQSGGRRQPATNC